MSHLPARQEASRVAFVLLAAILNLVLSDPDTVRADEKSDAAEPKKQTLIRVSKETTGITEPLDSAGFVDYVQAINDLKSKGVTAGNNFEVVVREVFGPEVISEDERDEYYKRIGMPTPSGDGEYYQDFITFAADGLEGRQIPQRIFDEFDVIVSSPWTAREHPQAARWVDAYDAHLDKLVEGSRRARFYTPYLGGAANEEEEPIPQLIAVLLPSIQQQREIARGLSIRAMYRLGEGRVDGAWEDLQAMRRIAQHVAGGVTLIESLVGIAIEGIAFEGEVFVLGAKELTDQQLDQYLKDLQTLEPLPSIADRIDVGERFMGLDAVGALARNSAQHGLFRMLKLIQELSGLTEAVGSLQQVAVQTPDKSEAAPTALVIDWNATLLVLNKWYDRIVAAAREDDFEKRKAAFESISSDLKNLAAETGDARFLLKIVASRGPKKAIGGQIGNVLVALLLPAVDAARKAEDLAVARRATITTAFAIEKYRRNQMQMPASLGDLTPRYVEAIPVDPLSGQELKFRRAEDAVLVYSVGRNGKDDAGRTYDDAEKKKGDRPEWDDVSVKVAR